MADFLGLSSVSSLGSFLLLVTLGFGDFSGLAFAFLSCFTAVFGFDFGFLTSLVSS